MVIESGIRQRIRLAATRLAEAASAGDLDATGQPGRRRPAATFRRTRLIAGLLASAS